VGSLELEPARERSDHCTRSRNVRRRIPGRPMCVTHDACHRPTHLFPYGAGPRPPGGTTRGTPHPVPLLARHRRQRHAQPARQLLGRLGLPPLSSRSTSSSMPRARSDGKIPNHGCDRVLYALRRQQDRRRQRRFHRLVPASSARRIGGSDVAWDGSVTSVKSWDPWVPSRGRLLLCRACVSRRSRRGVSSRGRAS
jgi:hypothetical protein